MKDTVLVTYLHSEIMVTHMLTISRPVVSHRMNSPVVFVPRCFPVWNMSEKLSSAFPIILNNFLHNKLKVTKEYCTM